jgi:hypothetical protein
VIILGHELVECGWPVTSVAPDGAGFDQGARRRHPAPEVAFVYLVAEDMLVRLLEFGQREPLWQKVECDVGVPELGLEPDECVVEHPPMYVVVDLDVINGAPVHSIVGRLQACALPKQCDITHCNFPFLATLSAQRIQLLDVLCIAACPLVNDPAS